MTLTSVFSSFGLEFLAVFNLASLVYHLRPGQLVTDFRFQISEIQILDFRFKFKRHRSLASLARWLPGLAGWLAWLAGLQT